MSHSQGDVHMCRCGGLCTWKWGAGKLYCQMEWKLPDIQQQLLRRSESTDLPMFPEAAEIEKQRNTFLLVKAPGPGIEGSVSLLDVNRIVWFLPLADFIFPSGIMCVARRFCCHGVLLCFDGCFFSSNLTLFGF